MTDATAVPDPDAPALGALKDKEPSKPPRSQWRDVWDQLRRH